MNASSNQTDANWNEVMEREWKCFSEEVQGVGYLKKYFVFGWVYMFSGGIFEFESFGDMFSI